jgi:plastocyanin
MVVSRHMGPVGVVLLLAAARAAASTGLVVEVRDGRGLPITGAVVYAVPEARLPAPPSRRAVVDQKNRMFVPHVLAIQTGTVVSFPNSDNVRHQVYSFSPAKKFQLPLYAGTPAAPVVFDKAGVVAIGCNIHDQMSAYLVVVDTPYFTLTADGRAELFDLPDGQYDVRVWYEGMRNEPKAQSVRLGRDESATVIFRLGDK